MHFRLTYYISVNLEETKNIIRKKYKKNLLYINIEITAQLEQRSIVVHVSACASCPYFVGQQSCASCLECTMTGCSHLSSLYNPKICFSMNLSFNFENGNAF